jgi:hypothetical protein
LAPPFVPGTRINLTDSFRTENRFHGGTVGASLLGWWGAVSGELTARVDVGDMSRRTTIAGVTGVTVPGVAPVVSPGGLLALASNSGSFRSSSCAVIPEIDLRAGYRVTEWLRVTAGYSLIVLTEVARAGDQVDLRVNPNLLPNSPMPGVGPRLPAFVQNKTDAWVQGITFGAELSW